jgi:hypothetical protein
MAFQLQREHLAQSRGERAAPGRDGRRSRRPTPYNRQWALFPPNSGRRADTPPGIYAVTGWLLRSSYDFPSFYEI